MTAAFQVLMRQVAVPHSHFPAINIACQQAGRGPAQKAADPAPNAIGDQKFHKRVRIGTLDRSTGVRISSRPPFQSPEHPQIKPHSVGNKLPCRPFHDHQCFKLEPSKNLPNGSVIICQQGLQNKVLTAQLCNNKNSKQNVAGAGRAAFS